MVQLTNLFFTIFDPRAILAYGFIAGLMYGYKNRHTLAKREKAWIPYVVLVVLTAPIGYALRTELVTTSSIPDMGLSVAFIYILWATAAFIAFGSIAVIMFNMFNKDFPGHFDPPEAVKAEEPPPKVEEPQPKGKSTEDILDEIIARNKRK